METLRIGKSDDVNEGKKPRFKIISIADSEVDSETEIAAEISLPKEGGWGWIVVAASFSCLFILDGIFFTFASIYKDMAEDLETEVSAVTLTNSFAMALYFTCGPIVAALINRFGFRSCTMAGSILVSFSYLVSYFADSYTIVLMFYGILSGFGGCFIYMSSLLVVVFYFERLRSIAMAIASLGQSFGVTVMSFANTYLVQLAGWRTTTLLHSGLFGTIYFIGMSYRPLITLTVVQGDEGSREINYLPSLSTSTIKTSDVLKSGVVATPTVAERLFNAPSNAQFPTAAEILEDNEEERSDDEDYSEPGISTGNPRKYKITINNPQGVISEHQFKQVASIISRNNVLDNDKHLNKILSSLKMEKKKWWQRLCHWERHVHEARPLYRDDAFYDGKLENLPVYRRSMMHARGDKTGLEYRMAVSRTVTAVDLKEKKGVFSTAVRRILATMMDPQLLKRLSFIMVCATGFLIHLGLLVPYVFLQDRNKIEGIDKRHCDLFVSVIGFCNALGKLLAGIIANKFNTIKVYGFACFMAGIGTIASNFSFNIYYQYFYCVMFGAAHAHISTLRSLLLVELYGLDNLTNATGVLLMFQGLGMLISTPLSSILQKSFGHAVSFYVAGFFMVLGSFVIFGVRKVAKKEAKARTKVHLISRTRSSMQRNTKKTDFKSMQPIPEKNV